MRHDFVAALALAAACGCGEEVVTLPSVQASSAHFRYFASSAERIPPGALDRLERHRQDVLGHFGISSESVVNYYRFDEVEDFNRLDRCRDSLACTRGKDIFTTLVFDQHELVHAYLSDWQPGYFLDEGTAEALYCGEVPRDWVFALPEKTDWREVVGHSPPDYDIYRWGVRLVLHLLRTHGPKRFISYYQTAHHSDDPALFALEFERFWGEPLDSVWAKLVEGLAEAPRPICPCGQAPLPADGSPIVVSAFDDYQVLPPVTGDQTIILSTTADAPRLGACDGTSLLPLSASPAGTSTGLLVAALRLDGAQYFVAWGGAGSATVSTDSLIAQDCSSAGLFSIPTDAGQLAFVTPALASAGWYFWMSGPALVRRTDLGPVSVTRAGDCGPSSWVLPWSYNMSVGLTRELVGLTSPADSTSTLQAVLFDIWR